MARASPRRGSTSSSPGTAGRPARKKAPATIHTRVVTPTAERNAIKPSCSNVIPNHLGIVYAKGQIRCSGAGVFGVRPIGRGMAAMMIAGQCTPHFLFGLAEKKTGRARSKRKGRLDALRCSGPPRATGVGVSVPAPIWTGLRARYALLRFLLLPSRGGWRRPRRGGCRMELLLFSLPLTLPRRIRQRVAQRNARKEKQTKCVLAPR